MDSKMESLQIDYLKSLQEYVDQLTEIISFCRQNTLTKDQRERLLFIAHRLAGNGAIFGFPDISKSGGNLQDGLIDNQDVNTTSFIQKISDLIDACNAAIKTKSLTSNETLTPNTQKTTVNKMPSLLVIDDDASIRNTIKELLKDHANIITGENSGEVLDLIQKHNPDLVLLDDMLPGKMSGLQILEEIKSTDFKSPPIIMLTASNQTNKVMRALMAGAVDYITKPFDSEELVKKIKNYFNRMNQKILIADDDEAVTELLKYKFTNLGFNVVCVNEGRSAWTQIQKQNFALIILDYMMPGFDGMSILKMMKENNNLAKTSVVFLTAKHSSDHINMGLKNGAIDYIKKPFDSDEVITRCIKVLNRTKETES